jgi:hypothetical protein
MIYMMITKSNPFENSNYDILIQNNMNGTVNTHALGLPPYYTNPKSKHPINIVVELVSQMLIVDDKIRPLASRLLAWFEAKF